MVTIHDIMDLVSQLEITAGSIAVLNESSYGDPEEADMLETAADQIRDELHQMLTAFGQQDN